MFQVSWWLTHTREPENLPVTQLHTPNMIPKDWRVQGGCLRNPNKFGLMWVEKCFSNWRELVSESKGKQEKAKVSFCPYLGCVFWLQKIWSKQSSKDYPVVCVFVDSVRLTTEISHHTTYKHAKIDYNKWVHKHIKTISINQDPKYQTHQIEEGCNTLI